jgi:gamma-glutamylcyclotransferase (GGCT)/AIG2-like uncharacterized protein YtfP
MVNLKELIMALKLSNGLYAQRAGRIANLSNLVFPQKGIPNMVSKIEQTDLIFCYGLLKRKFRLDLSARGGTFLGEGAIEGATLRPIGGGVGLRFDQDCSYIAHGEVFLIPTRLWPWLDTIENNGVTYTRCVTDVNLIDPIDKSVSVVKAWVYEHTYKNMAYTHPIPGGRYVDPSHVLSLEEETDSRMVEYEIGGEA